jgi:predicted unusual protein kinase regulating ubiquinone biosynthesis (AarF/ABC1/UbiB family)
MLHSSAPTHSFDYSKAVIEEMLGQPIDQVFDSIDPVPLASGSIAQVKRGRREGQASSSPTSLRGAGAEF